MTNSKHFENNKESVQIDDPERRIIETTVDMVEEELPLSKLRLRALEHAKKMPIDEEGSIQSLVDDYIYSQLSDQKKVIGYK